MFRFSKKQSSPNWKYIIGEILLIFIGINLAIWFNNWNEAKKIRLSKKIAIEKVSEEIESNQQEFKIALDNYRDVLEAYSAFSSLYNGTTSEVLASPDTMRSLQVKYPNFFFIKDSIPFKEGIYQYAGSTKIQLELPVLTEIAWKTTASTNISTELNFDCMYELESVYNLQKKVQDEINKAADALQRVKIQELLRILSFLDQLGAQLQEDYVVILQNIENCP